MAILFRILDGFLFLFITLLLIYDYFPTFFLKEVLPQYVIFLLLLGMLFINAINKNKQMSPVKDTFKSQLFFLLYVFILMFVLDLAGGESTVGLSFENRIFWLVVFIAMAGLFITLLVRQIRLWKYGAILIHPSRRYEGEVEEELEGGDSEE
ncbi:hypothetical protein [Pseudalkalibacillus hwajinpoensis]|uniref:hypothetical protein n=1 Tax=Guptibacillus hwajinpoensis TaxID=208199 RepID=UPI001CD4F066|nr:hypothetical protein [Pseudalkalibacillus hwajinpoensis]MCA0993328.1 hypothetical protein [Pseudalkalibacillus hwajinpoensis]